MSKQTGRSGWPFAPCVVALATIAAATGAPAPSACATDPRPPVAALPVFAWSDEGVQVSPAEQAPQGVLIHHVTSPFQKDRTTIRVLLPGTLEPTQHYRTLYVLPVEAREEDRYGDGLLECLRARLPDRYQLICVLPTFSDLPWYADHPTDARLRQESYLLRVVVPFVEQTYPVRAEPAGRLLVGFSKSGWGAVSLLLRHPKLFGRAAAWDAPLMTEHPDKYGMGPIFGTQENFERYRITRLLEQHAKDVQSEIRLIHFGYGNFREQHQQAHVLMDRLGIPHTYRDGPQRTHDWHSGWLAEAVEMLLRDE